MDARSEAQHIALAVDLDGTLIATDLLWESLFQLLRANPLALFLLPLWALKGKAYLKSEIARRVDLDPSILPYRQEVLARLKDERSSGRQLILATGSHEKLARSVSDHLGIFSEVFATDEKCNLTSSRKRDVLTGRYGDGGFDYAGNSKADIAVFDAARSAIVVAPDNKAARWQVENGGELIDAPRPSLKTIIKMLRVHQWLKNTLIAVPMVLSHEYFNINMLLGCVLAFVSFSAAASAIYIINDFLDMPLDRKHPTKKNRPFAAGTLSIPFGLVSAASLLTVSAAAALSLDPLFGAVLALYLVITTAYSFSLKRMLLIDVMTLAGLYTVRILAGAAATGTTVSFWLLAFSIFFFLSLALVKRHVELADSEEDEGTRIAGRGYRPEDLSVIAQGGISSAFASALVLALYIDSSSVRELYEHPWMIWPLAPIVLYLTLRIWVLAGRRELHDDPVVFLVRDWRSQLVIAIGAVLLAVASMQ
ncbi:MAG: UbiA family prenyltransferase [Rhizobiaceae bacterium]